MEPEPDATLPARAQSRAAELWRKYWWLLPVLLILLPTALAIFFLLDTPDDATLNYKL